MRKIVIFTALAGLIGFAAAVQAKDTPSSEARDRQVTREPTRQDRDGKHEREARNESSHERHDEATERRERKHDRHDENEAAEHRDRR
jgi:hypothetical protein